MFQFQFGSINSLSDFRDDLENITFQFQFGSINSFVAIEALDFGFCFNSNLVRLIAGRRGPTKTLGLFQFQFGSINR